MSSQERKWNSYTVVFLGRNWVKPIVEGEECNNGICVPYIIKVGDYLRPCSATVADRDFQLPS